MMGFQPQVTHTLGQMHLVIGDEEDICRFSAANVFKRCGFPSNKIQQVEGVEELCEVLEKLEDVTTPIMCVLNKRICRDFVRSSCTRKPFIVCSSSMARNRHTKFNSYPAGGNVDYHYTIPKTFEEDLVLDCVNACVAWWERHQKGANKLNTERIRAVNAPTNTANVVQQMKATTMPELPTWPTPTFSGLVRSSVRQQSDKSEKSLKSEKSESDKSDKSDKLLRADPLSNAYGANSPRSVASTSSDSNSVLARAGMGRATDVVCPMPSAGDGFRNVRPPASPFDDVKMVAWAGRGSFASVYKGRWGISEVAVKITSVKADCKVDPLVFEGALSSILSHPNLVQTYKYAKRELKDRCEVCIVQEWCNIGTLHQRLRGKDTPLSVGGHMEVMEVALEITSAVAYLHSRGVIHGDLSANNVLLCSRPCPKGYITKISDFGLSRILPDDTSNVLTASVGTITYMPPECFSSEAPGLNKAVDIYSFGVILWQLCTDKIPFHGFKPAQVVVLMAKGTSLELPDCLPVGTLRTALKACLESDPEKRPSFDKVTCMLKKEFFQAQTLDDLLTVEDLPDLLTDHGLPLGDA